MSEKVRLFAFFSLSGFAMKNSLIVSETEKKDPCENSRIKGPYEAVDNSQNSQKMD